MRRINRPKESPWFLQSARVMVEQKKVFAYLRRDMEDRRQRRDPLNDDIFFDLEFRGGIAKTFHEKCAFCEAQVGREGVVLHLRPLRFAADGEGLDKNYYLWLAFEWRNLFYSCSQCSRLKGDRFPVDGPRASYLASFEDIVQHENALLVDPATEDPHKSLRFLCDGTVASLGEEGVETIAIFDLNRDGLVLSRRRLIEKMLAALSGRGHGKFESLLGVNAPHSGALLSILRRVADAWLTADSPIKGSDENFAHRFIDRWLAADKEQRDQLSLAAKRVEDADSNFQRDAAWAAEIVPRYQIDHSARVREGEIARVEISYFKGISHLELEIPFHREDKSGAPALMIIGENATGKSSSLAAIALALIGRSEAGKLKKFMPSLVHSEGVNHFDQLDAPLIKVSVGFHFSPVQAAFSFDARRQLICSENEPSMLVLGYGARRFFDTRKRDRPVGGAARVRTLFDPLATIPYPADWLRQQTGSRLDTIAAALRIILTLGEDDELIVTPDFIGVRANGRVVSIDALSEGYRSVFVMVVDIIRELLEHWGNIEQAQAVVLIDELETHLHPRWKMQVMGSLRRVFPRVQFIVTTHDPLCLRGMDDGEVVVLHLDKNRRVQQRKDLPKVSGMSAEQLLTSDYFGLASTADPGTELALARLAGDVARRSESGELEVVPEAATMDLVNRLVVGNSQSQQIVQEALVQYLEARERRGGAKLAELRAEAVSAVIEALTAEQE